MAVLKRGEEIKTFFGKNFSPFSVPLCIAAGVSIISGLPVLLSKNQFFVIFISRKSAAVKVLSRFFKMKYINGYIKMPGPRPGGSLRSF
jgi:hypothetical protein